MKWNQMQKKGKKKKKEKRWEGEFNIKDEKLHSKVKKEVASLIIDIMTWITFVFYLLLVNTKELTRQWELWR